MPDEPIILVCAPADSRRVSLGAVFFHKCSKCDKNVSLAPTGQKFLREHPQAVIVCMPCYRPQPDDTCELTAPREEIEVEIATAVVNPRYRLN